MRLCRQRGSVVPARASEDPARAPEQGPGFLGVFVFCLLLFPLRGHAQFLQPDKISTRSVSGQFIAVGSVNPSKLAGESRVAADTNLVRLDPALLVVSAERIKDVLWRRLGINPDAPWRGQIYLVLHPAQSLNENVTIVSRVTPDGSSYQVQLADVLPRRSYLRAITSVLLLEFASRNLRSHSAEIPAWLTDGLAEDLLAADAPETILSMPHQLVNGLPVTRINATQRGLDPLAQARQVLQQGSPLTFEQLSWPTATELAGADGGVYRASAQMFVAELLKLPDGPADVRKMLEALPHCYNWQTAFQTAFRNDFPRSLDLEKWWTLRLVSLAAHDRGPGWTVAVSRARLDEILTVPVEMRVSSNSLPVHAVVSLQTVIRNLEPARRDAILQIKTRDLALAELRMAPSVAALADEYRRAIGGFLGDLPSSVSAQPPRRHAFAAPQRVSAARTLKTLDELDIRRQATETPSPPAPRGRGPGTRKIDL